MRGGWGVGGLVDEGAEGAGGLSKEVERKGVSPAVDSRRATPSASVPEFGGFLVSAQKRTCHLLGFFFTVLCSMSNLAC